MTKINLEENGGLARLKISLQELMELSEELLFESKAREENAPQSDVRCNAFTPWKSDARSLSPQQSPDLFLPPDSSVPCARPEQPEPRQSRPRRAAAVEADSRRKTWLEDLN